MAIVVSTILVVCGAIASLITLCFVQLSPWLGEIAAVVLLTVLVVGVPTLIWFADRARLAAKHDRSCCPACGYDLRATPFCCPECGHRPGR